MLCPQIEYKSLPKWLQTPFATGSPHLSYKIVESISPPLKSGIEYVMNSGQWAIRKHEVLKSTFPLELEKEVPGTVKFG